MGCAYPCDFCCINNLYGKRTFRFRDMKAVVEEIDILVNKYGVKNLRILDELFIIKHGARCFREFKNNPEGVDGLRFCFTKFSNN